MVKPPLRTKIHRFQSERGRVRATGNGGAGERCREVILRGGSASEDPALTEIIGVRLLLVNVLGPVAAGEKVTPEKFNQLLDQISEAKHQLAAKLQPQASEKAQQEKPSGGKR